VGHLVAKIVARLLQRVDGVLDGIVQQRGHQGGGVDAEIRQDRRDRQRMGDERLAAVALLAAVHPFGDLVGVAQHADVGTGMGAPVGAQQRLDRVVLLAVGAAGHQPTQAPAARVPGKRTDVGAHGNLLVTRPWNGRPAGVRLPEPLS
jgi:hypothetical protein